MIRMMKSDALSRRAAEPPSGLAAWILTWLRTPLLKRFWKLGRPRAARRMELVEVLALGGKRQLMLVVCDGRRYLVGAGGDSVQSIAEMGAGASEPAGLEGETLRVGSRGPSGGVECGL